MRAQRLLGPVRAWRWLLLNFPLLTLWDRDATVFGLPLLPAALFTGWALLIALRPGSPSATTRRPDMLSPALVIGASFAYLLLLFAVAACGRPARARRVAR